MTRVGILVVAYNAATTLASTLDRIPKDLRGDIHEVLVGDDASQDATHLVALGYQQLSADLPLVIERHPQNLGYGGNQKWGYRHAINSGWDIVVLLHADGQYAPELLATMIEPITSGRAHAVLGSRFLTKGAARRGGMPLYKHVGNRILTRVQNAVVGTDLSEWHSGYRAYDVNALAKLPLDTNSDDFHFDTQIIIQLHEAGFQIEEVAIPTYYGDEICYVDGLGYAKDVTKDVIRYRAHKMGFGTGETAFASKAYDVKEGPGSSHSRLLQWMENRPPSRVLDLGCSDGRFGEHLAAMGHRVVGVDVQEHHGVRSRLASFHQVDLDQGLPSEVGEGFDVVLAADVMEHVRAPELLLDELRSRLAPGGVLIASVPNFGHWYPRVRVALGRFDYDARGILDRGHLRFFTKRSFRGMVERCGWEIRRTESVGLPFDVADRGAAADDHERSGARRSVLSRIDRAIVALRPQLFAYQFLYELVPAQKRVTRPV